VTRRRVQSTACKKQCPNSSIGLVLVIIVVTVFQVVVPKAKGEILGVVIVESGWGSMLPTVVIANLAPSGAAARCGQLNIGDQIIAINGVSLVGLPLSTCQNYIKVWGDLFA
jgi:hypothetical protein